jgi:hypothetical protein
MAPYWGICLGVGMGADSAPIAARKKLAINITAINLYLFFPMDFDLPAHRSVYDVG